MGYSEPDTDHVIHVRAGSGLQRESQWYYSSSPGFSWARELFEPRNQRSPAKCTRPSPAIDRKQALARLGLTHAASMSQDTFDKT